jgi:hypothetical protein
LGSQGRMKEVVSMEVIGLVFNHGYHTFMSNPEKYMKFELP